MLSLYTSTSVNSTEFIVWDRSGESSTDGKLNVSIKNEWKYWSNKLALSESELTVKESKWQH